MRLKTLLQKIPEIEVRGPKDLLISGISCNSSLVAPGDLFIAKRGSRDDGNRYISQAIEAGAVCVLTDLYDPFIKITQLIHPDVRTMEAKLASLFFNDPSSELKMVGITGTNGKTTTSFLITRLLDAAGYSAGLIGSVEWVIGDHRFPADLTTPDAITCNKLLREMVNQGCRSAVMEVSSHALDQKRVEGLSFDIALFTNISQDHLDYHSSMEQYRLSKEILFESLSQNNWAILNADSSFQPKTRAKVMTYGIESDADLGAKDLKLTEKGIQFTASYEGEESLCLSPLIGKFNVYNLLGAIAVGLKMGIPLKTCTVALKGVKTVPGRLERIKNKKGIHLFVDFAHSPDALENVLEAMVPLKKGKLITVFGCGGERDQDKRAVMGEVATRLSDLTIVTSDNPRGEDPTSIIRDILKGVDRSRPHQIELDRKKAIEGAIASANPEDIVVIAGKGHEKQQILAHQVIPFDDVEIAKRALE